MASIATAEPIRIATFNTELSRKGPGLLLRDIMRGDDPQILGVVALIAQARPDVIVLQGIDHDIENKATHAFVRALKNASVALPYIYAPPGNAGLATGLDLNADGKIGGFADAQGFGHFTGMGGMAVLSRFPIDPERSQDFSAMLWKDLPDTLFPFIGDQPFGGEDAYNTQRLSSKSHWVVVIDTPNHGPVSLLTYHATPPVFDGPEDRNGRRNHDETAFWTHYLNGAFGPAAQNRFVLLGDANTDPMRGESRKEAIRTLLADPSLQTPFDNTPTADWRDPVPGDMRVDYLMPSADWQVVGHGRLSDPKASRHTLLWVDLIPRDP